ncbi:hypothetical protein HHI36_004700 [Cryptolaemus montrouzieri]|uniref:Uncharacterized protein n=1 Tax=Cryptolaemus montrouzieri TaxID=559131 RepID=A0ABD2NS12_9CUCU
MLVFIGCMGCISDIYTPSTNQPPHLQVSFTFGLAIMIAVQCFGHISGAHINPAVTIGAVVLGHTPVMQIPLYFGAQILGGIGGFGLLKVITPDGFLGDGNSTGICSPNLGNKVTPLQGASIEFALTFMLVMVCAAVWDCRNSTKHDSLTIRLGLAVAVLAMAGGPFTTANMNPARSFGPALINGDWNNWWVWWVGPMLGGLVAGLLYRFVFSREHDDIEQHSPAEILHLNDKI